MILITGFTNINIIMNKTFEHFTVSFFRKLYTPRYKKKLKRDTLSVPLVKLKLAITNRCGCFIRIFSSAYFFLCSPILFLLGGKLENLASIYSETMRMPCTQLKKITSLFFCNFELDERSFPSNLFTQIVWCSKKFSVCYWFSRETN